MEVRGLSATAIRDFLQCKLKLIFRYDKEVPSVKNDHAYLGTAVHEALEQFSRRMMNKKSFPDPSDYDFIITTFMNAATEQGLETMRFYTEGRKMVTEFVDRYDPAQEILDVEHRFRLTTPDGVPIAGAIDKVIKIDDDTIGIIDYKTARNALTPYELQDDIQLSMYDLAASIIWPQYSKRVLMLEYVRIDKVVYTNRSEEELQAFREFLVSIWNQVNKLEESEVTGKINNLCGWCDYKTYCPAYEAFIKGKALTLKPLTDLTDDEFLSQWVEVSEKKSILEARQRELKMIAHGKFMRGEEIIGDGKELVSVQQSRTNYDLEQVIPLMPKEDLFSVLAVNKARLDRYAKDDPELRNKLARVAQVSYNQPVYKTKAFKQPIVEEEVDGSSDANEDAA